MLRVNDTSFLTNNLKIKVYIVLFTYKISYFGDFPVGKLCCLRDNEAKISREEQIRLTIIEMLEWLKTF